MPGQFFEDSDPLIDAYILCLIQLILQHKAVRVPWSHIDILIVKLQRSHIITKLEFQLTQREYDLSRIGILYISKFQDLLAVVISFIDFIDVADSAQCPDIPHFAPIHRVGHFSRLLKATSPDQGIYFRDRYL